MTTFKCYFEDGSAVDIFIKDALFGRNGATLPGILTRRKEQQTAISRFFDAKTKADPACRFQRELAGLSIE